VATGSPLWRRQNVVLVVDPEVDLHPIWFRFDPIDGADSHSEDADLVTGEEAVCCFWK